MLTKPFVEDDQEGDDGGITDDEHGEEISFEVLPDLLTEQKVTANNTINIVDTPSSHDRENSELFKGIPKEIGEDTTTIVSDAEDRRMITIGLKKVAFELDDSSSSVNEHQDEHEKDPNSLSSQLKDQITTMTASANMKNSNSKLILLAMAILIVILLTIITTLTLQVNQLTTSNQELQTELQTTKESLKVYRENNQQWMMEGGNDKSNKNSGLEIDTCWVSAHASASLGPCAAHQYENLKETSGKLYDDAYNTFQTVFKSVAESAQSLLQDATLDIHPESSATTTRTTTTDDENDDASRSDNDASWFEEGFTWAQSLMENTFNTEDWIPYYYPPEETEIPAFDLKYELKKGSNTVSEWFQAIVDETLNKDWKTSIQDAEELDFNLNGNSEQQSSLFDFFQNDAAATFQTASSAVEENFVKVGESVNDMVESAVSSTNTFIKTYASISSAVMEATVDFILSLIFISIWMGWIDEN